MADAKKPAEGFAADEDEAKPEMKAEIAEQPDDDAEQIPVMDADDPRHPRPH